MDQRTLEQLGFMRLNPAEREMLRKVRAGKAEVIRKDWAIKCKSDAFVFARRGQAITELSFKSWMKGYMSAKDYRPHPEPTEELYEQWVVMWIMKNGVITKVIYLQ